MRFKIALLAVVALALLAASTAQATRYYLPISLAKHETREVAIADCEEAPACVAYGVGACERRSFSRVDCIERIFFSDRFGEEECDWILHWGVNYGIVALKSYKLLYCY